VTEDSSEATAQPVAGQPPDDRYPTWVLVSCLAGVFATTFTITILAVSLKSIAEDLDSRVEIIAWVITAPMLVQALALPVLGKMGDLYGHRRVFLIGFFVAALVTLLSAAAWDAASLITLRTLAQLMGTATMPASTALLFGVYPPERRAQAMGWVSLVSAGAPVLGLAVGGVLVDTMGWRPLFVIQGGLSLVAWAVAHRVLRESRPQRGVSFDIPGAFTLAVAAFAFAFGINRIPRTGLTDPGVLLCLAVVPISLALFVRTENRSVHPLLPLSFFRRRNFTAPLIAGFCLQFAYMGGFIITPLLLMNVFGYSATATSFFTMLRPVAFSIGAPIGGSLASRLGERRMAFSGALAIAIAMGALAAGAAWSSLPLLGLGLVLAGVGLGLSQPSLSASVGNAVDEHSFGIASSGLAMTTSIGAVSGISVLTALSAEAQGPDAFVSGYALGGLVAAFGVVAAMWIEPYRWRSADR
jgi:EmrB/QacA subfamily drug resistance transporter